MLKKQNTLRNIMILLALLVITLGAIYSLRDAGKPVQMFYFADAEDSFQKVFAVCPEDDRFTYTAYIPTELSGSVRIFFTGDDAMTLDGREYKNGDLLSETEEGTAYAFALHSSGIKGTIRFFFSNRVPSLFIAVPDDVMKAVDTSRDHSIEGNAEFYAVGDDPVRGTCKIKGRGNTTWRNTDVKKPYNLETDADVSLFGMGAQRKWSLIANLFDGSELRNKIALDTAVSLHMPFACESRFVNLYINGCYNGLYLLTQHIDVGGGNVHINDLGTMTTERSGFKKYKPNLIETTDDATGRMISFYNGVDPDNLTGGYLLEFIHNISRGSGEPWFETAHQHILIESPRYPTQNEVLYISDYMNTVEDHIWSDDDFYRQYLDMDSWTGVYLLREFFAAWDAEINSSYVFKNSDSQTLYAGPTWDYDLSMGQTWQAHAMYLSSSRWLEARNDFSWLGRLESCHEDFREEVYEKYQKEFAPLMEDLLSSRMNELYHEIKKAAEMDYALYPNTARAFYPGNFDEEYDFLCRWLSSRKSFTDDYFLHKDEYVSVTLKGRNTFIWCMKPGSTVSEIPLEDGLAVNWRYEDTGKTMCIGDVIDKSVTVTADASGAE